MNSWIMAKRRPADNQRLASTTNSVATPPKIKCSTCKVVKNSNSFSTKQIKDLKNEMTGNPKLNPTQTACIRCIQCTGGQVVELRCYKCDTTKGLDGFSKAQRRNPDMARCWTCAEEDENEGIEDDDDISFDSDSSDGGNSDDELPALYGDFDNLSVSGTGGVGLDNASYAYSAKASPTAPSISGASVPSTTTYTTKSSNPGPRSSAATSTAQTSLDGKWAKIPATKKRVVYAKAEEERQKDDDEFDEIDSD